MPDWDIAMTEIPGTDEFEFASSEIPDIWHMLQVIICFQNVAKISKTKIYFIGIYEFHLYTKET